MTTQLRDQLGHIDPLAELEAGVAAAADHLADLSALYERLPYASSVTDGAYSRIRPVIAEAWALTLHLMIDDGELDELRGRMVSRRYLHALVEELAGRADFRTGRNCMPGHVELGAKLGRPIKAAKLAAMMLMTPTARAKAETRIHHDRTRQVYNAIEVLKAVGVLVCVEEGRILDYIDRMEQVANGSDRRRARAVYALTLPRARPLAPRPRKPAGNPAARGPAPKPIFYTPRSGLSSSSSSDSLEAFQSLREMEFESEPTCGRRRVSTPRLTAVQQQQDAAPRRLAPKKRRLWELEEGHFTLVVGLRKALPLQLGGVSVRKLAGATKRFYEAGWDALSVAAEVVDVYDMMGRRFPSYRPGNPARWLGWVLKQVDHTVTPAMRRYEDWAAAADTEPCPHDWPGGARLSIVTGQPKCPLCRHKLRRPER